MVTPNIITINVRAAMFRIKTIVFFSLLLATLPVFAVSLKTVTVTGSIIPLRNGSLLSLWLIMLRFGVCRDISVMVVAMRLVLGS